MSAGAHRRPTALDRVLMFTVTMSQFVALHALVFAFLFLVAAVFLTPILLGWWFLPARNEPVVDRARLIELHCADGCFATPQPIGVQP